MLHVNFTGTRLGVGSGLGERVSMLSLTYIKLINIPGPPGQSRLKSSVASLKARGSRPVNNLRSIALQHAAISSAATTAYLGCCGFRSPDNEQYRAASVLKCSTTSCGQGSTM